MKKSAAAITFRAGIASTLCLSIFLYPQLRVSSAAVAINTVADVKSESQLRSEASSYDAAMQAIAGVALMTFAKPEDLKRAVDVLNRARPGLKFHRSKFVLIGLSDSAFINAARREFPNKQALETFSTQLAADPKLALTLQGASSLQSRIRQKIDQDAATLRRASERLRDAAARFKKAQAPTTPEPNEFKVFKAGFSYAPRDTHAAETTSPLAFDPLSIAIIVAAVVGYAVIIYAGLKWYGPYIGIGTQEDKDQVADCQDATDGRYNRCVDEARDLPSGLPFFLREVAEAACTLQSRMRRSDESDAATLRRTAEHLKAAGEKIKASAPRSSVASFREEQEFKVIRAGFTEVTPAPIDPVSATIIALVVTAVVIMAIAYGSALVSNATTDEGQDAVEACNQRNDARFDRCMSEIDCGLGGLLNPFCAAAIALCESDWLVRAAACLFAS